MHMRKLIEVLKEALGLSPSSSENANPRESRRGDEVDYEYVEGDFDTPVEFRDENYTS